MKRIVISLLLLLAVSAIAQVKPKVTLTGGDNVPQLKAKFTAILEDVLLETNRLAENSGDQIKLGGYFNTEAFALYKQFVLQNNASTARKDYQPQMVERERGAFYDIRSIAMRIRLGDTEGSDIQSVIFTFSREGKIVNVRAVIPNQDYHDLMRKSKTPEDSVKLGRILDFLERFRLAYNSKDSIYLEKVYSDDALIIVGTVLTENKNKDYHAPAYTGKIKLTQYTKREYLDNLKRTAFTKKSFLNVQLGDIKIIQHDNPRLTHIYGVSCVQQWNSSSYSDKGYLFLMMDFRNIAEPIIHVRTWQPTGYEDNPITLWDFNVISLEGN